jgi:hypothetical protein
MNSWKPSGRHPTRDARIQRALSALGAHPVFHFVTQPTANGLYKVKILSALGKLNSVEEIRQVAVDLCRTNATTKTALSQIRRRNGHWPSGCTSDLLSAIRTTVENYRAQHPWITLRTIDLAMKWAMISVPTTLPDLPFMQVKTSYRSSK